MRNYLFLWAFRISVLSSFGQSLPPVSINHKLSLPTFQPGKVITQSFNFTTSSYRQLRLDAVPIDVLLQLDDVPVSLASILRLGSAQQPESVFNGSNGTQSLVFRQSWVPGSNPLSVTFTDQTGGQPMVINLVEPTTTPPPGAFTPDEYVVDFCPDTQAPIQIPHQTPKKPHDWAYLRKGQKTRMIVKNINPLRYSVSVDAATLAFNTDANAVRAAVDAIVKNGIIAAASAGTSAANTPTPSETLLTMVIGVEFDLSTKLLDLHKLECISPSVLGGTHMFVVGIDAKLSAYKNQTWLDIDLKRVAADLEAQAKVSGVQPGEKARLMALAAYAKQDGLAKSIFAMIAQLKALPDGTTLTTDWVKVDEHDGADVLRFTKTSKNLLDSTAPAKVSYYDVWVVGKPKLDFSAGLILSGLADQTMAVQDEIVTQTVAVDGAIKDVKVVRQHPFAENRDKATLAIATLAHLYWRSAIAKSAVNFGLTLGGGITTKGRPLLLAGGSLMLGRQQRAVISIGASVGTQKELSTRYDQTSNYYITDPADAFTYVDRTRIKGFLGLTFSFGQAPKKETIFGAEEKK